MGHWNVVLFAPVLNWITANTSMQGEAKKLEHSNVYQAAVEDAPSEEFIELEIIFDRRI